MQPNISRVYFISANLIQAKYVADQVIHLLFPFSRSDAGACILYTVLYGGGGGGFPKHSFIHLFKKKGSFQHVGFWIVFGSFMDCFWTGYESFSGRFGRSD